MSDLHYLTIDEIHEGLQAKTFSAEELVLAYVYRIKAFEPRLKTFITLTAEEALSEAREFDKKRVSKLGFLEGTVMSLKDLFCTRGVLTTAGSKVLQNFVPSYDATSVSRLKQAGSILIGKNTEDEYGHGSSNENTGFEVARNPWNQAYVAGGSSGGSAVAVASGFATFALGTDTGGSVRLPASFCSCVGLKPTYGRISRYGVISMASSLDTVGILARSCADVASVLGVLAGCDKYDSTTPDVVVPVYADEKHRSVKGMKVGVPQEYFGEGLENGVRKNIEEAISVLKKLGMEVVEVSLPYTQYAIAAYYVICPSEVSANMARYDGIRFGKAEDDAKDLMDIYLKNRSRNFHDEVKRRIMIGTYALSSGYYDAYYLKAQKVRTLVKRDFERVFEEVDVLVTPTSPTIPFKLGEKANDPLSLYLGDVMTVPASLAGICGLSLPCGFCKGLPVGMQILGPQFGEERILQVGHAFEKETEWGSRHPDLA